MRGQPEGQQQRSEDQAASDAQHPREQTREDAQGHEGQQG